MTWTDTKSTGSTLTAVEYNNLANYVRPTATATVGKSEPADYVTTNYGSDDACIQAAIDYVNGLGGGSVLIREGTYALAGKITNKAGVFLHGINTQLNLNNGVNDHVIESLGNNTQISGFRINGNKTNQTAGHGIYVNTSVNCNVENCYIENVYSVGIYVRATCENVTVEQNITINCKQHGININGLNINATNNTVDTTDDEFGMVIGEGYNLKAIGNTIKDTAWDGIEMGYPAINVVIANNSIEHCRHGISIFSRIVGGLEFTEITTVKNINISDNVINNSTQYGIYSGPEMSMSGMNISNNTITASVECGMYITSTTPAITSEVSISNNTILSSTKSGIKLKAAADLLNNFAISNCVLKNCSEWGIIIENTNYTSISNCIIDECVYDGIILTASDNCNISNVNIKECRRGINLYRSQKNIISGSIIKNNDDAGVYIYDGGSTPYASYNMVVGCQLIDDQGTPTQNYGIHELNSADNNIYSNNRVVGNTTGGIFKTGANSIRINNIGYNPRGAISPPSVPATTVNYTNAYGYPCTVVVSGGTVTEIDIDDIATGLTSGVMPTIPPGGTINITYSAAPSWLWWGL